LEPSTNTRSMKVRRSKTGVLSDIDYRRTRARASLSSSESVYRYYSEVSSSLYPPLGTAPSPPLSWRLDYSLNTCYSHRKLYQTTQGHEPRRLDYGAAYTRQTTGGHTNGDRFLCSFGLFFVASSLLHSALGALRWTQVVPTHPRCSGTRQFTGSHK